MKHKKTLQVKKSNSSNGPRSKKSPFVNIYTGHDPRGVLVTVYRSMIEYKDSPTTVTVRVLYHRDESGRLDSETYEGKSILEYSRFVDRMAKDNGWVKPPDKPTPEPRIKPLSEEELRKYHVP